MFLTRGFSTIWEKKECRNGLRSSWDLFWKEGPPRLIALGSFKSSKTLTGTRIPQGSSFSPVLFLFFASTILLILQTGNSSAVRFVNDLNTLIWSNTTEENSRKLEQLHEKCEVWAKSHGIKFAPDKYQLMHFSRDRKRQYLKVPILIQSLTTDPQVTL